jgi:hypothetical protein
MCFSQSCIQYPRQRLHIGGSKARRVGDIDASVVRALPKVHANRGLVPWSVHQAVKVGSRLARDAAHLPGKSAMLVDSGGADMFNGSHFGITDGCAARSEAAAEYGRQVARMEHERLRSHESGDGGDGSCENR